MSNWFSHVAVRVARISGHYLAFVAALAFVLIWFMTGPLFGFSDTWQLVINTSTTIVTFLMVFLIQNSQNRDSRALHLKLDELIRSIETANYQLIDAEDDREEELDELQAKYAELSREDRLLRESIASKDSNQSGGDK